ncbi:MAG: ABC transporter permease [Pseudomonadales bacterium]|jgi:ABC-2 type transport system permease protein|nr:ABC transporter permease [Pseudomonadales bacterium]MDA0760533.1 ABC transporter permease subunit [Pseudomonadota bacterium]MDA0957175.1 ABC transporter permease subunit [Pseudomonadota bacterium]
MNALSIIIKREFSSYFATPLAYVFILVFLVLSSAFTFYLGQFYERGQADLLPFFNFHPWLYLFLIPAVSMRLWSEERKTGSIELLLTLPITLWDAILGKFLAAWAFVGLALVGTFPIWLSVNYLGQPDNGAILAGYMGSWLMSGAFLAIGCCMSALTKNQIIAFILTGITCLFLVLAGFPMVLNFFESWVPSLVLDLITGLSIISHFIAISKGVLALTDLVYFFAMMVLWLYLTHLALAAKAAD